MTTARLFLIGATVLGASLISGRAAAQGAETEAIVNGLFAASGNHERVRASGAKGVCLKGAFTPSAEAPTLSKAPHFSAVTPVIARFSLGGGNPNLPDRTKPVTRGLSMRLSDPSGDMVFVFISAPVFGTRTPEQLLEGLRVRAPGPDGKPDAEAIKAYVAANPETTRQAAWLNARPVPASWAGVDYWGVHAFTLTNAAGQATVAKLRFVAGAGQLGLSDEELKAKPDQFYANEIRSRLTAGPVTFDFLATLAAPGDPTNDITAFWPEEQRRTVRLGTLSIKAIEPSDTCDSRTFDPVIELPEGVAGPADDPMFEIRSPAYAISLVRRGQ